MITYNNIVAGFKLFTDSHFFLKTFSHGTPDEIDLEKLELYPLLHLSYLGADYSEGIKTYNLECYILDGPPTDSAAQGAQQANSVTDSEMVAEDILADITIGGQIFDWETYRYQLNSSSTQPLERTGTNSLAGVLLSIGISVPYDSSSCNPPFIGIAPGGSETQTGASGAISIINYTSSKDTTYGLGATDILIPNINDGTWLSSTINLSKSISFVISAVLRRNEIHGLNSSAIISGEFVFKVSADGAGLVAISLVTSGAAFSGTVNHTFTSAGSVELTIPGTTTNISSVNAFFGASILSTTAGTVTLSSVQFTINNQF